MFTRKKPDQLVRIGPPRTVYHDTLIAEHFAGSATTPYRTTEYRAGLGIPAENGIYRMLKPLGLLGWHSPYDSIPRPTKAVVHYSDGGRTEYRIGSEKSHEHEVIN